LNYVVTLQSSPPFLGVGGRPVVCNELKVVMVPDNYPEEMSFEVRIIAAACALCCAVPCRAMQRCVVLCCCAVLAP
jgi:hypothetical protein